jgi:hypothetical protein
MIIVRLIGGLGNQCFQYAIGRHLAELRQTELKLDISEFENYKLHAYSLGNLNILEKFASPDEVAATRCSKEKHFHFDSDVFSLPDETYLHGYWQSEKYFAEISEIIRKEITVKLPLSGKNKEISEEITSCASVSLHIRRADYVTETIFQPCSLDYYLSAVKHIAGIEEKPHFFVFTDDKAWVREHFKLNYSLTFVEHNGPDKNYEDLRLMSSCKHNIIANSTFSWWAAWLNINPCKIVFAPSRWFTDKVYSDPKDLIPASWLRA